MTFPRFSNTLLLGSLLCAGCGYVEPPAAQPSAAATPSAAEANADAKADAKPKREPIYVEEPNGKELIAAALKRAGRERKHVVIEWGGNWCGWCYKLHDVFASDQLVAPVVAEEYELVLIDSRTNDELLRHYGGRDTQFAYPHLTILDAEGQVLTNQETSSLEIGRKHDPQKVAEFLKKWQPEHPDAESLLAAAIEQAASEDKRILLHAGTPYCGWCKILTAFLDEHKSLLARDYIDLRLDTMRMRNGKEVADRFLPAKSNGVPWMVILDATGKALATSVAAEGNIGYPYQPAEIDHFLAMLGTTKQRLTEADLDQLRADLNAYRHEREKRAAAERVTEL
jgi:thiol-disulfide isomerase/thioredoxin